MNNNKGFTVVELILAIAIAGIIMGAIGSFLVFNLKGFNVTKNVIDIQYEGQLAMNQLTSIAMESEGIEAIKDENDADSIDVTTPISVNEVLFNHKELNGVNEETTTYLISYDDTAKKLSVKITYPDTSTDSYVMARYVTGFSLEATGGQDFEMTKSVEMHLSFGENMSKIDLQSHVKFRNMHE